ncbi:MAG: glycosyltransferase [Solirubrobacteraceae bacterium]|jgi:cellulose synthase/poly-beta-1,6-N-acetylglucosamine synthase-like glycosyltransferase
MIALTIVVALVAALTLCHSLFLLTMMLYAWDDPDRLEAAKGPSALDKPRLRFTVLLPARSEETVIAETILRVWRARYPRELLEIVVICQRGDSATIAAVEAQIAELGGDGVRLETYDDAPFNKPHALQVGYHASTGEVLAVFDAEDDVDSDIFGVVNTMMGQQGVGVVQGAVQLMNVGDHWFAPFNCLEYFFHYQSRLHFYARVGMVPLGGNTVFIRRDLVDRVGGWDVTCLTEDADIGMRISALGEPIAVVSDSRWATREETPHSVDAFVRQRTRWHQGFLQILARGVWLRLPSRRCRLLALITLSQPIIDAALLVCAVLLPLSLLFLKLPDAVALLTFMPLYALAMQLLANLVGVVLLARKFAVRVPIRTVLAMPITYLPYQWMVAFSALRALLRCTLRQLEWEKTEHLGAHRRAAVIELAPQEAAGT